MPEWNLVLSAELVHDALLVLQTEDMSQIVSVLLGDSSDEDVECLLT